MTRTQQIEEILDAFKEEIESASTMSRERSMQTIEEAYSVAENGIEEMFEEQ